MSQGAMDVPFVVVPHPMGMIPLAEIRKKAEVAFPEILKAATAWQPKADAGLAMKASLPGRNHQIQRNGKRRQRPLLQERVVSWRTHHSSDP